MHCRQSHSTCSSTTRRIRILWVGLGLVSLQLHPTGCARDDTHHRADVTAPQPPLAQQPVSRPATEAVSRAEGKVRPPVATVSSNDIARLQEPLGPCTPHFVNLTRRAYAQSATDQLFLQSSRRELSTSAHRLIEFIEQINTHGIDPAPFGLRRIDTLYRDWSFGPARAAPEGVALALDLAVSCAFLRVVAEFEPAVTEEAAIEMLVKARSDMEGVIADLMPRHPQYERLRKTLKRYSRLTLEGVPTIPVPKKGVMVRGIRGRGVLALKKRLAAEGYLSQISQGKKAAVFDRETRQAVKLYQRTHQQQVTGKVRAKTARSLNVPMRRRLQAIVVALHRWRQSPGKREPYYTLVNVPGFWMELVKDHQPIFRARTVVGSNGYYEEEIQITRRRKKIERVYYRRTPLLSSQIRVIVFNPDWRAPQSIVEREIPEKLAQDPQYLKKHNLKEIVVSGKKTYRQPPSPDNVLGRVKFEFPNPHRVYMHDTNDRSIFTFPVRHFSHGCVRVEHAVKLSKLLLKLDKHPDYVILRKYLAQPDLSRGLRLKHPVPIHLVYIPVSVDETGHAHFHRDIYGYVRDRIRSADLSALDIPKLAHRSP